MKIGESESIQDLLSSQDLLTTNSYSVSLIWKVPLSPIFACLSPQKDRLVSVLFWKNFESKLWRPEKFAQNTETSDSDTQPSRLACVCMSFRIFLKSKLK